MNKVSNVCSLSIFKKNYDIRPVKNILFKYILMLNAEFASLKYIQIENH